MMVDGAGVAERVVEAEAGRVRHPATVAMLRTFRWDHLPPHLQRVSRPFGELAHETADRLPDGPELTACLRKLRESKDCAVVALVQALDGS